MPSPLLIARAKSRINLTNATASTKKAARGNRSLNGYKGGAQELLLVSNAVNDVQAYSHPFHSSIAQKTKVNGEVTRSTIALIRGDQRK